METSELDRRTHADANSSGRPVSPVRSAKMVRLVESEIAKVEKKKKSKRVPQR